jgi:hypothetical protein
MEARIYNRNFMGKVSSKTVPVAFCCLLGGSEWLERAFIHWHQPLTSVHKEEKHGASVEGGVRGLPCLAPEVLLDRPSLYPFRSWASLPQCPALQDNVPRTHVILSSFDLFLGNTLLELQKNSWMMFWWDILRTIKRHRPWKMLPDPLEYQQFFFQF